MTHAIVNASELGTNCWSAHRFCGGECKWLETCKYPEKRTCKAHVRKGAIRIVFAPGADVGDYQI